VTHFVKLLILFRQKLKQLMQMNKEVIANRAQRLADLASAIGEQLHGAQITLKERFCLDLLRRQAKLLRDVASLLRKNHEMMQDSSFILFRCLLDDFIKVLYIAQGTDNDQTPQGAEHQLELDEETENIVVIFDDEKIIQHTASGMSQVISMKEASYKLNRDFFNSKLEDLASAEYVETEWQELIADPTNHIYFKNVGERKWKAFPTVRWIVDNLPFTKISKANAHVFVVWKMLSNYVHFSQYVARPTHESRGIEISQLCEVMSYCFKTVVFLSSALKTYGLNHVIIDPTNLKDEIFEGYQNP
jgi:hypothetical protein